MLIAGSLSEGRKQRQSQSSHAVRAMKHLLALLELVGGHVDTVLLTGAEELSF